MRPLSYCLYLAVATFFINAARLSAALALFRRPRTRRPTLWDDTEAQLQLNVRVKNGLKATEKTFLDFVKSKLDIKRIVFLHKFNTEAGEGEMELAHFKQINWRGLTATARYFQDFEFSLCFPERTLVIFSEVERLTEIYQEVGQPHHCVVALSDENFKDSNLRSVAVLTQDELGAFIADASASFSKRPVETGSRIGRFFRRLFKMLRRFFKSKEGEPPSLQELLQFLEGGGEKALVFGVDTPVESLKDFFDKDFKQIAKLMKADRLLLYIVSFKGHETAEDFESYKREIEKVSKDKGIKPDGILDANPSYDEPKPSETDYLVKIQNDKNLAKREIVLIYNKIERVQSATFHGSLAIYYTGQKGFEWATVATFEPLSPRRVMADAAAPLKVDLTAVQYEAVIERASFE